MGKSHFSRLLRLSILLLPGFTFSQEWNKLKTLNIPIRPTAYSTDIQGSFYLGFSDGRLTKYDSEGEELQTHSISNQAPISLIEAQNNLKLFIFNFDNQKITFLDRFSTTPRTYPLIDFGISLGMMICPAPDGNFWIAQNNPRRLIKFDFQRKEILFDVQTSIGDSIKFMRVYQNILIVSDEGGIHVYDQFGTKKHSLSVTGVNYFQVVKDRILFSSLNECVIYNPFKGEIEDRFSLPSLTTKAIIKLKENYLVIDETLSIYSKK